MTERPILFSDAMVRAIIEGKKTQTRRMLKPSPGRQRKWLSMDLLNRVRAVKVTETSSRGGPRDPGVQLFHPVDLTSPLGWIRSPYGSAGDRLWVKECHRNNGETILYRAGGESDTAPIEINTGMMPEGDRWRPSIFMPRWASRISLEITGLRVERLNDITEADARAEGCPLTHDGKTYDPPPPEVDSWQGYGRYSYSLLWSKINGPGSWDLNPWVWVISFRVCCATPLLKSPAAP